MMRADCSCFQVKLKFICSPLCSSSHPPWKGLLCPRPPTLGTTEFRYVNFILYCVKRQIVVREWGTSPKIGFKVFKDTFPTGCTTKMHYWAPQRHRLVNSSLALLLTLLCVEILWSLSVHIFCQSVQYLFIVFQYSDHYIPIDTVTLVNLLVK